MESIQQFFKSDIRSMINYMQSNSELFNSNRKMNSVITDSEWELLIYNIKNADDVIESMELLENYSIKYNIEYKDLIITFISYHIENKKYSCKNNWIDFFKFIVHNADVEEKYLKNYFTSKLYSLYKSL